MNLITYTPAPWAVGKAIAGEPAVVKRDGDDVTILAIVKVNGDGDTDANALLMAAAPDLLTALQQLMRQTNNIEVLGEWAAEERNHKSAEKLRAEVDAVKALARAAIDKATTL